MGEHQRTKFITPEKPKHPLGWVCENCSHVVKDTAFGSSAMKCVRYPPTAQYLNINGGQACIAISPPVQAGEWCSEFSPLING